MCLAVEPLNRFETDFLSTVTQGLELLRRVDSPAVGLLLDTFHMNMEEPSLPQATLSAHALLPCCCPAMPQTQLKIFEPAVVLGGGVIGVIAWAAKML